ncbi:MAG: tetratricopeptide repeat protein [bacterium]
MTRTGVLAVTLACLAGGCPTQSGGGSGPRRARLTNDTGTPGRRAAPRPRPTGVAAIFVQGVNALKRRPSPDYEGALAAFQQVLEKRPRHLPSLRNLAYCQLHLEQLRRAEATYRQALKVDPKRGVLFGLVDVLQRRGQAEKALPLLLAQLKRTPTDLTTLGLAAACHLALRQHAKALALIQTALAIDRRNAIAHLNFGGLYLAKGDARTALMIYGRGLRLKPNSAALHFGRGQAFLAQKEMGKAVMDFERAAKLDTEHVAARLNLGKVYVDNLDYKGALAHFGRVLQIWPRHQGALLGQARALFGLRRFKQALAGYQAVIKRHGIVPGALFQIGKIYQDHLDQPRQALLYYKKFVRAAKGLAKEDPVHATIRMLEATAAQPRRTSPARRGPGGRTP